MTVRQIQSREFSMGLQTILLLLGEKAGMREDKILTLRSAAVSQTSRCRVDAAAADASRTAALRSITERGVRGGAGGRGSRHSRRRRWCRRKEIAPSVIQRGRRFLSQHNFVSTFFLREIVNARSRRQILIFQNPPHCFKAVTTVEKQQVNVGILSSKRSTKQPPV